MFEIFASKFESHMAVEEEVLFPAYEGVKGIPKEPMRALREEHQRIMRFLLDIRAVLKIQDANHVMESLGPFEEAMLNHHEKEESFFLPMAEYFLNPQKEILLARLQEFNASMQKSAKTNASSKD